MMESQKIRFPAVAGQFYPAQKRELEAAIDGFLERAEIPEIRGEIFGLLVPHAGYPFSGFVAAHSFKAIEGRNFETVILIGDSHYERFDGVSVWERGEWETPLGKVEIDEIVAREILSFSKRFFVRDSAHLFEHSLEVQLPFLQKILKSFKIVPIIFGSEDRDWKNLAATIFKIKRKRNCLVVASSDLSHYPPYEIAQKVDRETIEAILEVDPQLFVKKIKKVGGKYPQIDTLACGQDTIKTILELAKNLGGKAELLKYQNSGDSLLGDKFQVVGYCAIAFIKNEKRL